MQTHAVDDLKVLLRMALAKAKAPYTRKGMGLLATTMAKTNAPKPAKGKAQPEKEQDAPYQRYLDEQILKKIEKPDVGQHLRLDEERVAPIAQYLGYKDYEDFEAALQAIQKAVQATLRGKAESTALVYDIDDHVFLGEQIPGYFHEGQTPTFESQPTHYGNKAYENTLAQLAKAHGLVLWWQSIDLEKDGLDSLNDLMGRLGKAGYHNLLPIWGEIDIKEKQALLKALPAYDPNRWVGNEQVPMLAQWLGVVGGKNETKKMEETYTGRNLHITDSGTVVLGNINSPTFGDFASSKDLHIGSINHYNNKPE